ncbi:MAG: DUF3365 domain-containing protein [Fuerstiella sp.]
MHASSNLAVRTICPLILLALIGTPISGDEGPASTDDTKSGDERRAVVSSVGAARVLASVLHEAMHATLQTTHDRYYREDEGLPIPAAIMKNVFEDIKTKQNVTLRWLVVEGQAMNTDHVAKGKFEEAAVKLLKAGELSHEEFEDGIYRRAAPITLSNHCLKCHVPDRKDTRDRKAGLIVSVPVAAKASH